MYILKTPLVMSIYVLREKKSVSIIIAKQKKSRCQHFLQKDLRWTVFQHGPIRSNCGNCFLENSICCTYLHLSFYKQVLYFQRNISQSWEGVTPFTPLRWFTRPESSWIHKIAKIRGNRVHRGKGQFIKDVINFLRFLTPLPLRHYFY